MRPSKPTRSACLAPCSMPSRLKARPSLRMHCLRQRKLASYLVGRNAHYHFTVKGNQKALEENIALLFQNRAAPHHEDLSPPDHGRIETRRIWCSTALNDYLDFPHVGQVFLIERDVVNKKSGLRSVEHALGITSQTPQQANPHISRFLVFPKQPIF